MTSKDTIIPQDFRRYIFERRRKKEGTLCLNSQEFGISPSPTLVLENSPSLLMPTPSLLMPSLRPSERPTSTTDPESRQSREFAIIKYKDGKRYILTINILH